MRSARSLIPPHAFENVGEPEIDLTPLHIHSDDLNADLIAEPIDLPRALALQHMLLLEEPVVVVRHARDVNKSFDVMLAQLDEQAERRDAGDETVVLVADLVGHETHLLPLQQL